MLRQIQKESNLNLQLIVSGMHLSAEFGMTIDDIRSDGFPITETVDMLLPSDSPEAIAKSMGQGTVGFAQIYTKLQPDILLVLGDRFEMHSAVVAALPFNIPVAHIHGGESTEGLIDEAIRHSITKMSHLHFTSTEQYRNRIIQMGEEPWRVTLSGAPSLDNLANFVPLSPKDFTKSSGLDLTENPLLVTYHPVTLEYKQTLFQMSELLMALDETKQSIIFTFPNADTHGRLIISMIRDFAHRNKNCQIATNLGTQAYFTLMSRASAMVGNSSSGIIEAASFKLPVVNIGNRQRGRLHAENVLDVGYNRVEIASAIATALSKQFRDGVANLINPYGDGQASTRIVGRLKKVSLDSDLLLKRFHTLDTDSICA